MYGFIYAVRLLLDGGADIKVVNKVRESGLGLLCLGFERPATTPPCRDGVYRLRDYC